jgi:hypothetical protein
MALLTTPGNCSGRLTGTCPVTGGAPGSGPGPFYGSGIRGRNLGTGGASLGQVINECLELSVKKSVSTGKWTNVCRGIK